MSERITPLRRGQRARLELREGQRLCLLGGGRFDVWWLDRPPEGEDLGPEIWLAPLESFEDAETACVYAELTALVAGQQYGPGYVVVMDEQGRRVGPVRQTARLAVLV